MTNVNLKEIQQKLYEKLKPSGWGDKLKMFLLSDEFYTILKTLWEESSNGQKFTPVLKQLFRAFEECPYNELKVVIIGQDPYPTVGIADGIAFSSSNFEKIPASLKLMFDDIEKTIYPEGYVTKNRDLKVWANQGVLLLNLALTTSVGKPSSHLELWKPFTAFLFDMLNTYNTGLIYLFMGVTAKEYSKSISSNNYKFFTKHPASSAYLERPWNSGNSFNQINKILKHTNNTEIIW